jgi:SAM-dependent methyltransferase
VHRHNLQELLDQPDVPEPLRRAMYADLDWMHRVLGTYRVILSRLAGGPARTVLDLGCGDGALLARIRRRLGARVIGVDLQPPPTPPAFPILRADAINDPLPRADAAVALLLAHHLSETELQALVRNARRSVRRLLLLDIVRSRLPLTLFRWFIAPFVHPAVVEDGIRSFHRAYRPGELRAAIRPALDSAHLRHTVAPLSLWQLIEITWPAPVTAFPAKPAAVYSCCTAETPDPA